MHSITVKISQAAQQAAVVAGLPASAIQSYALSSEQLAEAVALGAQVSQSGEVTLDAPTADYHEGVEANRLGPLAARPADAAEALAMVRARRAEIAAHYTVANRAKAEERAREEHDRAEERERRQRRIAEIEVAVVAFEAGGPDPYPIQDLSQRSVEQDSRIDAERKRRTAAEAAARLASVLAWIEAHGSERLREAVRLGLLDQSEKIYEEERLAAERPGWTWERECDDCKEILNPSLDSMRAYADVHERDPAVTLVYLVSVEHSTECIESPGECICEREITKGPALQSTFLDRSIVRRMS
jgi:hypothetical protein